MPAPKPKSLIRRHETNEEKNERESRERAVTPKTALGVKPPKALTGHKWASERWKRLISLYGEVEGELVTSFDEDLLVNYCLVQEELHEDLPLLYKAALALYKKLDKRLQRVEDEALLLELTRELTKVLKEIKGIDARKDVKRSLALKLAQSSYLTPRSRAGVAPAEKPVEDDSDPMEKLLND